MEVYPPDDTNNGFKKDDLNNKDNDGKNPGEVEMKNMKPPSNRNSEKSLKKAEV